MFVEGDASPLITFSLTNNNLLCYNYDLWYGGQFNWALGYVTGASFYQGGAFYIETGAHGAVTSSSNTYKRCYPSQSGGVFSLPILTTFTDTSSSFL